MTELRECPFCGGDAAIVGYGPYRCVCRKCGASTASQYVVTMEQAITVWNTRAADARIAELEAEVERLQAAAQVKPLEWQEYERGSGLYAHSILGQYSAWEQNGVGYWNAQGIITQTAPDGIDAATTAAQANYEQRIKSALVTP